MWSKKLPRASHGGCESWVFEAAFDCLGGEADELCCGGLALACAQSPGHDNVAVAEGAVVIVG
jgi:hypothetical protein